MVIHPYAKIWYAYVKKQWQSCQTLIHFNIDVKGQGHTEVMNECNTLYHGDTLMSQT